MLFCSPDHPIIGSSDPSADCVRLSAHCLPSSTNLLRITNDDLRSSLIINNLASNLHPLPLQRLQVTKLVLVGCEDHAGKRAGAIILTEIQEGVPGTGGVNSQDKPGNAAAFALERPGIAHIHTGRRATRGGRVRGTRGLLRQRAYRTDCRPPAKARAHPHPQPESHEYEPRCHKDWSPFHASTPARVRADAGTPAVYQTEGASAGGLFKRRRV